MKSDTELYLLAQKVLKSGYKTIEPNNPLHSELSSLTSYEFSKVTILLEDEGKTLLWNIIPDSFEIK